MDTPALDRLETGSAVSPRHRAENRPGGCSPILPFLVVLALVAGLLAVPPGVSAQERETPRFSFDGFGTLGLVYSSEDDADFAANALRADGAGHTRAVSPEVDSRLGGQVAAVLTSKLTAVAQLVAEQDVQDEYVPALEWAYLDYAFTRDFSVRAGRMPLGIFMVSEFRKVSFANPWLRPPVEMYNFSPVTNGLEIEATYRLRAGDWSSTLETSFGRSVADLQDGEAEGEKIWTIASTAERGAFTGHARFVRGELDIDSFDPLFDAFREFGPEGEAIADRYEVDDTSFQLGALGAEYDPGPWFGLAEVGWVDFNSFVGEKLGGYATVGRRFGPFTPNVTYARVGALSETTADGLTVSSLPPRVAAPATNLNESLDFLLQSTAIQQSVKLGGRWDFSRGMALKGEVQFIDLLENSPGPLLNEQPGFERGGSAQLVSLATVFVF